MQSEKRLNLIQSYLQQVEFATLKELISHLNVSYATLRRDLLKLEQKGIIRRCYGGARILNPASDEFVFQVRNRKQVAEKEAIAKVVAELIQPGQTVIIDGGTTTYRVAQHLKTKQLQIITNSLPVANLYSTDPKVELILTGGVVYPRLGVLLGPIAVDTLRHLHADIAIIGAAGVTEEGIWNSHSLVIDVQRAIIEAAHNVILCIDHTKLGKKSVAYLGKLEEISLLVTDQLGESHLINQLQQHTKVILAPLSANT